MQGGGWGGERVLAWVREGGEPYLVAPCCRHLAWVSLAWVRGRGEHYLCGPLLPAGINSPTVDSLLFISLFQFLCPFSVEIPFSFVFFGLFPYRFLKSIFVVRLL